MKDPVVAQQAARDYFRGGAQPGFFFGELCPGSFACLRRIIVSLDRVSDDKAYGLLLLHKSTNVLITLDVRPQASLKKGQYN